MNWKGRSLESWLPLLAKELHESAARPRTFAARTAYAVIFYSITLYFMFQLISQGGEVQVSALARGHGGQLFRTVFWAQVGGIFIFLPAMVADAIARERERNSL